MSKQALVVLTILVCSLSLSSADEGRIPIFEPTVITQGGHYFVTRNISAPGTIVTITATEAVVELDLNGYMLTSEDPSPVISATGDGLVIIRNGTVLGGSDGIFGGPAGEDIVGGFRVERVIIANPAANGINIIDSSEVEIVSCEIFDPLRDGIAVISEVGRITGNFINSPEGNGIYLKGRPVGSGVNPVQAAVTGNVVKSHRTGHGILVENSRGVRILDNFIVSGLAADWGVKLDYPSGNDYGGAVVRGNTIRGQAGTPASGILVYGPANHIQENVVTGMSLFGIRVEGSRNTVKGNLTGDNLGDGILIGTGSGTLIDDNNSEGNTCGISFSTTGNAYRDNMLRENTISAVCGSPNTDAGGNIP